MLFAPGIRLSRADRKEHILHELKNSSSIWYTTASVGKLIGIKPSTHLRTILWEMVEDGRLTSFSYGTAGYSADGDRIEKTYFSLTGRPIVGPKNEHIWGLK